MQLLIVAFSAWLIAHLIKFSLAAFHGRPDLRLFYQSGGMPSAHSATVVAIAVASLTTQGYQSPIFGLAAVLAVIVIYDTLGIRRSGGEQSVAINTLSKLTGNNRLIREVSGHTPKEVAVGIGLGTITGFLFTFQYWSEEASWLTMMPGEQERFSFLVIYGSLIVSGVIGRIMLTRYRKVTVIKTLTRLCWWALVLPGFMGLFVSLLQYQTVGASSWRLWSLLLAFVTLTVHAIVGVRLYYNLPSEYHRQVTELSRRRREQRKPTRTKKRKKR